MTATITRYSEQERNNLRSLKSLRGQCPECGRAAMALGHNSSKTGDVLSVKSHFRCPAGECHAEWYIENTGSPRFIQNMEGRYRNLEQERTSQNAYRQMSLHRGMLERPGVRVFNPAPVMDTVEVGPIEVALEEQEEGAVAMQEAFDNLGNWDLTNTPALHVEEEEPVAVEEGSPQAARPELDWESLLNHAIAQPRVYTNAEATYEYGGEGIVMRNGSTINTEVTVETAEAGGAVEPDDGSITIDWRSVLESEELEDDGETEDEGMENPMADIDF